MAEWLHQKNTLPRQQPIETSNHLPLTHTTSFTIWLFNIAMESGPFLDDFPIKTSIYKGFSMAMLNNQMVVSKKTASECTAQWAHDRIAGNDICSRPLDILLR